MVCNDIRICALRLSPFLALYTSSFNSNGTRSIHYGEGSVAQYGDVEMAADGRSCDADGDAVA